MPWMKSVQAGAAAAIAGLLLCGQANAAPAPSIGSGFERGAVELAVDLAAALTSNAVQSFTLNAQRDGDRRGDRRRGGDRRGDRRGGRRADGDRRSGSRSDGRSGRRADGDRGGRAQRARQREDLARRNVGERRVGSRGGSDRRAGTRSSDRRAGTRRDDRRVGTRSSDRRADRRSDRGSAYRAGRRDERRADRRTDSRRAYRAGRRDERRADYRRDRRSAYRGGSSGHRYYRSDRRRYSGHGPRRAHGYWHPQRRTFIYNSGYDPLGWLIVNYGYNLFSRSYIGDCEVVGQTFYRRGRRYEEVALLCYDDWGYGYIRPGSRRVYRTW